MHKVVIERPRWNPGPGKFGRAANLPDELLPKVQGMRRPYVCRKNFTDLLGPLRRWLHSQVGRPWNDVYSEACAVIKPDSVIRAHVKTHLLEFVERYTCLHNGEVCVQVPGSGKIIPLKEMQWWRVDFYVHPKTGLLEKIEHVSRRQRNTLRRQKHQDGFRWLSDSIALKQIDSIWYACQFRPVSPDGPFKDYDHAAGQVVGRGGLLRRGDVYLHCIVKRQLSKRELRRYSVINSNSYNLNEAQSSVHPMRCNEDCVSFLMGRRLWVIRTRKLTVRFRRPASAGLV